MRATIETFRPVTGYEGRYEVSDTGCVRSLDYNHTGKRVVLKTERRSGYERVHLWKDGTGRHFSVHRLVWNAFRGQIPESLQIDHIDGNKLNNSLSNLRAVTPSENMFNPNTYCNFLDAVRDSVKRRSNNVGWLSNVRKARKIQAKNQEWLRKNRESSRKAHNKPVQQLDKMTGEVIHEWECAADAMRELNIDKASISRCCLGKVKTAGGYGWRFK